MKSKFTFISVIFLFISTFITAQEPVDFPRVQTKINSTELFRYFLFPELNSPDVEYMEVIKTQQDFYLLVGHDKL